MNGGGVPGVLRPEGASCNQPIHCWASQQWHPARILRLLVAARQRGKRCAALIFLVALPLNVKAGFKWRYWFEDGLQAVEADIAARTPLKAIARRHREFLLHWNGAMLEDGMTQLHDAGMGPFATVPAQ